MDRELKIKHIIDFVRIQLRRYSMSNDWAVDIYSGIGKYGTTLAVIPVTNVAYEYTLEELRGRLGEVDMRGVRSWIRGVLIAEGFDCDRIDKIRKLERTGYYHIRSGWTHLITE